MRGPIRHEWDGVFRIGDESLFGVIGYFDVDGSFLAIDAYLKSGTKLSAPQRKRIDDVAALKQNGLMVRRVANA